MRLSLPLLIAFCSIVMTSYAQNVGIGNTSPNSKVDVSGDLALREGTAITVAAGANTLTLPTAKNSVYRLTGASGAFSITSISAGNDGMLLTLINATGQVMTVTNGTIQTNTGANLVASGTVSSVNLIYNATLAKWIVVSNEGMSSTPGWNLTGNAGTTSSNFVGTTDNNPLYFKTNGAVVGYLPSSSSSTGNTGFGVGNGTPGGSYNVFMGFHTLAAGNTGNANVSFGWNVLDINSTGHDNIGMGFQPLAYNTTGAANVALGASSLMFNKTGNNNVGVGASSLQSDTTGSNNIAIGVGALNALYNGSNNTVLGYGAGSSATGSSNVFLGYNAGANELTSNKLYIANSNTASPLIYGDFSAGKVTINNSLATTNFQMTNGATNGYILKSDASGNGTWVSPSSITANNIYNSDGTLTGNRTVTMSGNVLDFAGGSVGISTTAPLNLFNIQPASNASPGSSSTYAFGINSAGGYNDITMGSDASYSYLQSWESKPLQINSQGNNVLFPNSRVGIGTTSPAYSLDVNGQAQASGSGGSSAAFLASRSTNPGIGWNSTTGGTDQKYWDMIAATSRNAFDLRAVNDANSSATTWIEAQRGSGTSITSVSFPNGKVGIGTTSPAQLLDVNGTSKTINFQMTNGATTGYVLQSDASGNASWVSPTALSSSYWTLSGSNLYNNSGNYIGIGTTSPNVLLTVGTPLISNLSPIMGVNTTGSQPLFIGQTTGNLGVMIGYAGNDIQGRSGSGFTTNGILVLNQYGGNVGVGTASPGSTLTVNGTTSTTNFQMTNGANANYVLQSDGSGNGTWVNPTSLSVTSTNIYNADGTLTGNRTVTQGADNITFNSTSGNFNYTTSGNGSVSMGNNVTASGNNSFATGLDNVTSGNQSLVSGTNNNVSGNYALVAGNGNTVSAQYSNVSGVGNQDWGTDDIVGGFEQVVYPGYGHTIAIGYQDSAIASAGAVFGFLNKISAFEAFAQGDRNTASGQGAAVFGGSNIAAGSGTFVTGYGNTANGSQGFTAGINNNSESYAEMVVGTSATNYTPASTTGWSATDRVFNVGNGSSSSARSDAFTILKNGNVGVGNNTPTKTLQVNGTISTTNFQMTSGAGLGDVLVSDASGNGTWTNPATVLSAFGTGTQNYVTKWNNAAGTTIGNSLIYDNGTRVGIGTTSPGATLQVNGSITMGAPGSGNQNLQFTNGSGYSQIQAIAPTVAYNSLALNPNGGNVGIGLTSPDRPLTIQGSPTNNDLISYKDNGGTTRWHMNMFATSGSSTGHYDLNFAETGIIDGRLYLQAGGNVGINSTAPAATLDINGPVRVQGAQSTHSQGVNIEWNKNNGDGSTWFLNQKGGGTGGFTFGEVSTANVVTTRMLIDGSGNVGIGTTTPAQKLDVNGTTRTTNFQMTSGGTANYLLQSDASGNATWVNPNTIAANNIYNSNGTLTGNRTVTQGADNITFNSTTGNFIYTTNNVTGGGVALGYNNTISSTNNTAIGSGNTASAAYSTAIGFGNAASGQYSIAMGSNSTASGKGSSTNGYALTAPSYYEIALGASNTTYTPASATTWSATDRLFGIGNGASPGSPSDAFVILKNGNTGVGTASPSSTLQVNGKTTTTNLQMTNGGTANYLLQSDASGNGTWVAPSTIAANNIYNSDGTLTGNRTVTMGSNNLYFNGSGNVSVGTTSTPAKFNVSGNAVIGTSLTSRSGSGLTVDYSNATTYAANTDVTDAARSLSIVNEGSTANQMAVLAFRSNPSGGANNQMFDMKYVNPNDGTSKLIYSFGPNVAFTDRFTMTSSGAFGLGTTSPTTQLANTSTNIIGSDGNGTNANSLTWAMVANGYVAALYNGSAVSNANGLAIKGAGTASTNRLLDISTGASQNVAGTSVMQVLGNGQVGIGTAPSHTLDVNGVINTATGYEIGGAAASGNYLRGNGTNFVSSAIQPGDLSAAINGTTNYVAKFTGANTIGNGIMYDNGSAVGFSTTTPSGTIGFNNNGSNIGWGAGPYTSIYDNANLHVYTDDVANYESGATGTGAVFNWNAGVSVTGTGGSNWMKLYNGQLSIGGSNPGNALDVQNGNIDASGYIQSGGTAGGAVLFSGATAQNGGGAPGGASFYGRPRIGDWGNWLTVGEPNGTNGGMVLIVQGGAMYTGTSTSLTAAPTFRNTLDNGAGRVGIGTTNPGAPLDVEAVNATYNEGSYRWFANSGSGTNTASCTSCNVSIYTPNRIEASEFDATSDRRIKKDITPLPAATALERANQLNVVTFRYIDQLSKGKKNKTGFIAQEVESVMPNAVNQDEGFIPNVFDAPSHAEKRGTTLVVTTAKGHDFAEGDQVRIYDNNNKANDVIVAKVITPNQFEVANWENSSDSLFVYGKKVTDYRNVDFDQITAVAIGAVQELNKKLIDTQAQLDKVKAEKDELRSSLNEMKNSKADASEVEQLKAQIEILKQIIGAKVQK